MPSCALAIRLPLKLRDTLFNFNDERKRSIKKGMNGFQGAKF